MWSACSNSKEDVFIEVRQHYDYPYLCHFKFVIFDITLVAHTC